MGTSATKVHGPWPAPWPAPWLASWSAASTSLRSTIHLVAEVVPAAGCHEILIAPPASHATSSALIEIAAGGAEISWPSSFSGILPRRSALFPAAVIDALARPTSLAPDESNEITQRISALEIIRH